VAITTSSYSAQPPVSTYYSASLDILSQQLNEAGAIDIWSRESGLPNQRFQPQLLQDEGLRCLSWRRLKGTTATFATAGEECHVLNIWKGEETILPKSPTTIDASNQLSVLKTPKASSWPRPKHAMTLTQCEALPSSGSLSPQKLDTTEEACLENLSSTP
jgi:hypothetical protein